MSEKDGNHPDRATGKLQTVIVAVLFFVFALNLLYIWHITEPGDMKFRDGPSYIKMALQFQHHGNFDGYSFRTPGYPLFLIPFFDGHDALRLKLLTFAQTMLLIAAGAFFYLGLVRLSGFNRILSALIAAITCSQFQLAATAQLVATEVPAFFLITLLVFVFLCAAKKETNILLFVLAGLLCGFLALVRPQFYWVVAVLFLVTLCKKHWKGGLAFVLVAFIIQGGWVVRNQIKYQLPYPSSSVTHGIIKHLARGELYRHADYGKNANPFLVELLMTSDPDVNRFHRFNIIDRLANQATGAESSVYHEDSRKVAYLKNALASAISTPQGARIFFSQVLSGAYRTLGTRTGWFETKAVISTMKHHIAYYIPAKEWIQDPFDRYNPWMFAVAAVVALCLIIAAGIGAPANKMDVFHMAVLVLLIGLNAIIAPMADVPLNGRYGIGVVALYPWLYMIEARMIWKWIGPLARKYDRPIGSAVRIKDK